MCDNICLEEKPFFSLYKYQLSIEMLESHNFDNKLKESIPTEILDNVINCKYYCDIEFNSISKCSSC